MSYRGRGRGGYYNNTGSRPGYNGSNGTVKTNDFGVAGPMASPAALGQQGYVQVEIWGWNNASPQDLVSFLSRKTKISVFDHTVNQANGAVVGHVRSQKDAESLMNWNGVKFAGQSLKFSIVNGAHTGIAGAGVARAPGALSSTTMSTVQSLKEFLKMRYNAQAQMLDLSGMQNDQFLISRGLLGTSTTSATSSKMFIALMKLASDDPSIVVNTVNLSNNSINDTFSNLSLLGTTFPRLLNLSLDSNRISKVKFFETWKLKFSNLRELVLLNNPVQQAPNYQFEMMKIFPKLILLDGQILRDEAKLQKIYGLPIETKQMFFETPDIHGIATSFVSNYINLWDTNRQELMGLYSSPESQFSLQVDSTHPSNNHDEDSSYWAYYMPNSRNLSRISNERSRMARLNKGAQDIYKIFQQIPKTKHPLLESPHLFSMESYSYPQVNGIIITIHGEFDEIAIPEVVASSSGPRNYQNRFNNSAKGTLTKRSFDRTFVVVQGPNQGMIIASDMLLVRSYGGEKAWSDVKDNPTHTPVGGVGGTPANGTTPPVQVNLGTNPAPAASNTALLLQQQVPADILNSLNASQQALLAKVFEETRLNAEFSLMLCQQSNWDYQTCINSFHSSKGNIPINAYQH